jgi:predicted PhzF superfamily epimerase YddE/YHI9
MDWFVEMESEREVLTYQPDMNAIEAMGLRGLILTAKAESGTSYDFVSRFFAPQSGVPEDSVTGSAHSALAPYWTARLGKPELIGLQASERSGILHTVSLGDRVRLGGLAEVVVEGTWKSST